MSMSKNVVGAGGSSRGTTLTIKTVTVCVIAYAIGIALSPYVFPYDDGANSIADVAAQYPPPTDTRRGVATPAASATNPRGPRDDSSSKTTILSTTTLEESYRSLILGAADGGKDPFAGVEFVIHRNGESDPCSRQQTTPSKENVDGLSTTSHALLDSAIILPTGEQVPLEMYTKYSFDAMLTRALTGGITKTTALLGDGGMNCGPTWKNDQSNDKMSHNMDVSSMLQFCDMGVNRTTRQLDHAYLIQVPGVGGLPCHFHTREGVRVTNLEHLANLAKEASKAMEDGQCENGENNENNNNNGNTSCSNNDATLSSKELHLYAVPAGRVFMFAPKYIGEIFHLPHIQSVRDLPVSLEVISLSPRVFDVYNFFDRAESQAIVDKALKETSETHKMKRSSTGASGYTVNSQRTSENGFDTHGKQAQAVKRRCMNVLGFDEYEESLTDGLQVLRYNKTTAYVPHLDWIDDYNKLNEHDFDSEHLGTNRFATILLYMTDLNEGDGGETVFAKGWPPNVPVNERIQFDDAKKALRESGDVAGILEEDSWQENMVARCRSRLAIRPHSSRAVLFYSQNPDGTPDQNSLHGGCPVITDAPKWAANLWVWNGPRGGFPGSPVNQHIVDKNKAAGVASETKQIKASFANMQTDETMKNAELFFQDTFWGKLGFGDPPLNVNTFKSHQWNVKVGENVVKTFIIDETPTQKFTI